MMSTVIHKLWVGEDASPLILPGSIPLDDSDVNSELLSYLPDSWKVVVDTDVDGPNAQPARIDREKPVLGQRSLTKRLARTVFFGAAPTIGSAHKGIETQRVFLGTAVPGDAPGNFHTALAALGDRATYFYSGSGKYWYDLQANITRTAKDQADRLHVEDVWAEIVRRLKDQQRTRGQFAGVHPCPEESADIPDTEDVRLVLLHPKYAHRKQTTTSSAYEFARAATERRGGAARANRNMVVFLAADEPRLEELEWAVRDFLGWQHVLDNEADLDLTTNQRTQAEQRRSVADTTAADRLLQTFVWALVPDQPDPQQPFTVRESRVEGQGASIAERVSRRLSNDGHLSVQTAGASLKVAIDKVPRIWRSGHVSVGELWRLCCTYPYLPRLRDRAVLDDGVKDLPLLLTDAYALATSYDGATGRYLGLWAFGDPGPGPAVNDAMLLVRPDMALRQREADEATLRQQAGAAQSGGAGADGDEWERRYGGRPDDPEQVIRRKTRYFGSKELSSDRYVLDFKRISDEVLAHLGVDGIELKVRIDIEAVSAEGFDETKVRTVSENATTLGFSSSGFEET
jgi:hypothetical protein